MADTKEQALQQQQQLAEGHIQHHEEAEHIGDELQADQEAVSSEQDAQQYEQQYDESYVQQYEAGEDGQPGEELYETQGAEYDQDGNAVGYDIAANAADAVASAAAAAAAPNDQDYVDQQQGDETGQEYVDQQHVDDGQGYVDDPNAQQIYADQDVMDGQHRADDQDEQTLASHPASSREMEVAEAMVVDGGHGINSEVSQAIERFDYSTSNPDGLETLAATSSAVTQHGADSVVTPVQDRHALGGAMQHMYHNQKPLTPKFNRSRNWTREETKVMLSELHRIVSDCPDDRREVILRSNPTFDQVSVALTQAGYNREGQGCMIRWRNLLRVYKQHRMAAAEGGDTLHLQNMPFAEEIESIYRFPPDGIHSYHIHGESGTPGVEGTPSGHSRTWSQANGSYETPTRKRAREISAISEHIERMDQKLDQALEILTQQSEIIRSVEDRLARAEESAKHSEMMVESLHATIAEKDAKRDELEKQLMVTVQALSQVIAVKKAEEQQLQEQEQQEQQEQEQQ
ncbi:hypothetical protein GGI12_005265 [Dipsacomyces acuminosporus]|nr:hypothetical protein GGI12_005265 [Dipsacomyces acuminosporus]